MDSLEEDLQRLADEISRRCKEAGRPVSIVLIGSLTRGFFRSGSDIDFCLISLHPNEIIDLLPEWICEGAEVYGNHENFVSISMNSFRGIPNEITVKVFHVDRLRELFQIDRAVMCYI